MLKKSLAMLIVLAMVFALAACGNADKDGASSMAGTNVESVVENDAADGGEQTDATEGKEEDKDTESTDAASKDAESKDSNASNAGTTSTSSKGGLTLSTGSKANGTTSTQKPTVSTGGDNGAVNQSDEKNITAAYENLKVKSGKSVTEGLNFKGKTFTMAITSEEGPYHTQSFKRTITAFEKKYNCKIKLVSYGFASYNKQVYQALSSGNAPEICYAHGSMFPACAIDNLYNDLSNVITTADLMDDNNPTAGGIDLAKSSYFVYNNKMYGICNYESCFPAVIYYNKVAMADAGFSGNKDPRKMAESGKWTWNLILQMGKKLTNVGNDVYFLANSFSGRNIMLSYGAPIVKVNNGKYTQNVTSTGYMAGLELIQQMFCGSRPIAEPRKEDTDNTYPYPSYKRMLDGKTYMFVEETSKYLDMAKDITGSSAFQRSKNNIGITTVPLGPTNTRKLYPTGWLTAVCSGKGTDPKVAVAWETFRSSYNDPITDSNAMSKTDQKFVDDLLLGGICCEVGDFATSSDRTIDIMSGAARKITQGADISQTITSLKDKITACIKASTKK